jgi:tetratricopeptide (TPR) repeat protein
LRLAEGRPAEAVECVSRGFSPMAPRLLDFPLILINFPLNQDVLARACVAAGRIDAAIAEYEQLVTFDPQGQDRRLCNPRYNYRLARLYEQTGQPGKARGQYESFLALWQDDGRNLPEFADARERLERLAPAAGQ